MRVSVLDGTLYARIAGDGAMVSTPIGSSGYAISAGGPLLADGLVAFVFTPLPKHGGFARPWCSRRSPCSSSRWGPAFGGARLEVDGQVAADRAHSLTVRWRDAVATMVSFDGQESLLAGLRRRRIILDSPRVSADADGTQSSRPSVRSDNRRSPEPEWTSAASVALDGRTGEKPRRSGAGRLARLRAGAGRPEPDQLVRPVAQRAELRLAAAAQRHRVAPPVICDPSGQVSSIGPRTTSGPSRYGVMITVSLPGIGIARTRVSGLTQRRPPGTPRRPAGRPPGAPRSPGRRRAPRRSPGRSTARAPGRARSRSPPRGRTD